MLQNINSILVYNGLQVDLDPACAKGKCWKVTSGTYCTGITARYVSLEGSDGSIVGENLEMSRLVAGYVVFGKSADACGASAVGYYLATALMT